MKTAYNGVLRFCVMRFSWIAYNGGRLYSPGLMALSFPNKWSRLRPRQKCSMMWNISSGFSILPNCGSSDIIKSMSTFAWMKSPSVDLRTVPLMPMRQCSLVRWNTARGSTFFTWSAELNSWVYTLVSWWFGIQLTTDRFRTKWKIKEGNLGVKFLIDFSLDTLGFEQSGRKFIRKFRIQIFLIIFHRVQEGVRHVRESTNELVAAMVYQCIFLHPLLFFWAPGVEEEMLTSEPSMGFRC